MAVIEWELSEIRHLREFYNRQIASIPYCFPALPDEFEWGICHQQYDDKPHEHLHSERLFVDADGESIYGFVHIGIEDLTEDDNTWQEGIIRFLGYKLGRRASGQALLEAAENHFRALGLKRVKAFPHPYNYRFYHIGWGLSDRLAHLGGLFGMNGYEPYGGELFLGWRDFTASEPTLPDENATIVVHHASGRGALPGVEVHLHYDGHVPGACEVVSLGDFHRTPEAQATFFVYWLGVDNWLQGRGWGYYLLQRTHWELKQLGYRHALISTNTRNYRAQLFYTNFGYQALDSSYELAKNLS